MPRGYTLVWSGWEPLVPVANLATNLTAAVAIPIAKNPDGSTITGPAYEYSAGSISLSYPPATLDKSAAKLTHRVHMDDVAQVVDPALWNYNATATGLTLTGGFVANDIYEFSYTAKDPTVAGLGFAAVRDINSWLRYATADDAGHANPLANYITRIYTEISSQPGRLLNDFRSFGFNEDESGRKVLDGLMEWISAGSGIGMNYRFSQSGPHRAQSAGSPVHGEPVSLRQRPDDRPVHGQDGQPLCEMRGDRDVPARRRDLFSERVLGQERVTPAHDAGRRQGSARFPVHAQLLHDQHAARHGQRHVAWQLPIEPESAELVAGPARVVPRVGQMGDRRRRRAG
jgi:hypothetical protein